MNSQHQVGNQEKMIIQGGVPLFGTVQVSGAKNSVLKLMAGALLTQEAVTLTNVPQLTDVDVMAELVRHLGANIRRQGSEVYIEARDIRCVEAPYELVSKMRASFIVLGALLGRCAEAKVSLPGGCSIGKRGVDLHIKGLQALGADIQVAQGFVEARASKLTGADIVLDTPSVGATENIMLAAVLAEGLTVLANAAQEPEITDLANFLNALGADIHGAGTSEILIHGVCRRELRGTRYNVVPDRIEAATFLMAVGAATGEILVEGMVPQHLQAVMHKLTEMGVTLDLASPTAVRARCLQRLLPQNIVTQPYPGFPTDLQAPFMTLLAQADGVSIVTETIYENRFKQIGELKRMGANIQQEGNVAIVTGVERLTGTQVKASDLRAGAALVLAGLQSQGQTEIFDLHHIDRGYDQLLPKLTGLGAHVERVFLEQEAGAAATVANPNAEVAASTVPAT
jgi:UDP-N-acetylglucosamine 1-carboxyvinyltransferase